MKKQNPIDQLVENLSKNFAQIKNFDLTQDNLLGKKMFNFVIKNASELTAFKNLFIQYYLPASLKSTQDFQRDLKFSKYKHLIHITQKDLKENYYETIRLGYVGVYHKYESYLKELIVTMNIFFKELDFENNFIDINLYLKKELNIDLLKTINNFKTSEKINWISNCVKHYDGFPIKQPTPNYLNYFDKSVKIEIESSEFKNDLENLLNQSQLILTTLFMVGFHQLFSQDFEIIKDQLNQENKNPEAVEKLRQEFEFAIVGILSNRTISK